MVRIQRTSSSRISAAVPGNESTPASLAAIRKSADRQAGTCHPVHDLHRGERVHVQARGDVLDRAAMSKYAVRATRGRCRPACTPRSPRPHGLDRPGRDLVQRKAVGVGVGLALRERTEPAAGVADVGEVDVPVDHVGDLVTDRVAAQVVGQRAHRLQRGPSSAVINVSAWSVDNPDGLRSAARSAAATPCRRGAVLQCADRAADRSGTCLDPPVAQYAPVAVDVLEVPALLRGRPLVSMDACRSVRPAEATAVGLLPRQTRGQRRLVGQAVGSAQRVHVGLQSGVEPRTSRYGGCAVSRSRSTNPASAHTAASLSICGHGRSGFTWSGVNGLIPPKSSTPASSSARHSARSTRLGGAWTRIDGPIRIRVVAIAARYSSSPRSSTCRIARVRLGSEVLHDHLLDRAVGPGDPAQLKIDSARSASGLADPDQQTGRERHV